MINSLNYYPLKAISESLSGISLSILFRIQPDDTDDNNFDFNCFIRSQIDCILHTVYFLLWLKVAFSQYSFVKLSLLYH
jgi:hypothetical protein